VAGHLGVSHNPKASASAKHASHQAILKSASSVARPHVAGKIGVASNLNAPKSIQHNRLSYEDCWRWRKEVVANYCRSQ
jgi:hypothetical protein